MNIFVLDNNPRLAAKLHCNKHVVKMIVESTQMLCTTHSILDFETTPYKPTHIKHPCTQWVMKSEKNYEWLLSLAKALCSEYTYRYGKRHACEKVIRWCELGKDNLFFTERRLTPFAQAMPVKYKREDPIEAYRIYYREEKKSFAKWTRRRVPKWMN